MITSSSNWYVLHPSELDGDRLDFVCQHPALENIRQFRRSARVQPLRDVITSPEYGLSESGRHDGETGFLNVQHLTFHGEIVFQPETYLSECPPGKLLEVDDVLIARTGHTLGKAARVTEQFEGYTFGSFCMRFRILPDQRSSSDFVVHFINSKCGQGQILMLKTGAGKYNLNSSQVADIRIPRLGHKRQEEILDPVRAAETQAMKLEQRAREVREVAETALVTRLGVPLVEADTLDYFFRQGAEDRTVSFVAFPDEVVDRIHYLMYHPRLATLEQLVDRYSVTTLDAICSRPITRGEQPDYADRGVMVIKTADLRNGYIEYENCLAVSEEFFENYAEAHPEGVLRKNDILIASTGYVSMGKVDIYDRDAPAMADGHISILRANPEEYDPYFVAYFLRSHLGQLQFEKWFTGSSGQIEIQPPDLGRFILPDNSKRGLPIDEQRGLAAEVTARIERARDLERLAREKRQEAEDAFEQAIV